MTRNYVLSLIQALCWVVVFSISIYFIIKVDHFDYHIFWIWIYTLLPTSVLVATYFNYKEIMAFKEKVRLKQIKRGIFYSYLVSAILSLPLVGYLSLINMASFESHKDDVVLVKKWETYGKGASLYGKFVSVLDNNIYRINLEHGEYNNIEYNIIYRIEFKVGFLGLRFKIGSLNYQVLGKVKNAS